MKKALITTLQVAVTVFALYWVFRKPETRAGMGTALHHGDFTWLLAALAIAAVPPICATARWWLLLRVQDIRLTVKRAFQLYMVGMFFNLFLLGSTGGDAVKLFYLLRERPDPRLRAGAFMSVVMDRLVGMVALIILSAGFVLARYHWLTQTRATAGWVNGFLVILGLILAGIVAACVAAQSTLLERLPATLPGRTAFIEVSAAIRVYTRAWQTSLTCIFISFFGHGAMFVTFYFAARVMRAGVAFWDVTVVMPIINTYVSLPFSLSGIGVREQLFTTMLGDLCHLAEDKAVLISLIGFLCSTVFFGLIGAVMYLFYRSAKGAPPAHVEEVEAREAEAALPAIVEESQRKPV